MRGALCDLVSFNIDPASYTYPYVSFLSHTIFPRLYCANVSMMEFRQDSLYLFHHCIVLGYSLDSSLPSILYQARSQNNSLDKTKQRLWKDKATDFTSHHFNTEVPFLRLLLTTLAHFLSTSQKTTKTRHLLWYFGRINLTKQERMCSIFKGARSSHFRQFFVKFANYEL